MSGAPDLDLEAILAEYHAQERGEKPSAPAPEPQPRRRRAPEPVLSAREPAGEDTALYRPPVRKEAAPAAPPQPTPPRTEKPKTPQPRPKPPQPKPQPPQPKAKPTEKPAPPKAEKRGAKGGLRMALVLTVFIAVLAGLLYWTVTDERAKRTEEPEPLRLELAQAMGDYLEEASLRSHG